MLTARVIEAATDPNGIQVLYTLNVGKHVSRARLSGWGAEVSWSPDSSALAITQTEGGGGIGYRVYLLYVESNRLRKVDA